MNVGIVVSRVDKASMCIWNSLSRMIKFREVSRIEYSSDLALAYISDKDVIHIDEADEWAKNRSISLLVFLSRHEMRSPRPIITFHTPGNWTSQAEYGGKPRAVAISEPRVLSWLYRRAHEEISELEGFDVTIEATHHGPFVDRPTIFAEIGSSEREWGNAKACEFLASIVAEALEKIGSITSDSRPVAISIGDLHYITITDHVARGEYNIGHVVPKYVKPDADIVKMAVERNSVRPSMAIVHWKALKSEDRPIVEKALIDAGVSVVKRR